MGYTRSTFNPETYIRRGQTTKQMHFSCLGVLCVIIPKITGYSQFSLIRPTPTGPTEFLYIDPAGVILMQSLNDTSATTIALLIDHNVQVPAKFTDKVTKQKIDAETNPQVHAKRNALHHLTHSDFMATGQSSIMDTEVTQEERERLARPPQSNPEGENQRRVRNANSWERKAKANRRLLKNAKANGIDTDAGAVTTGEECPSGNLSLWHWLPASDLHSWPTSSVTSLSQLIFGGSLPT